jgi:hypothetical protein
MKTPKIPLCLAARMTAGVLLAGLAVTARADGYEGFDYPVGTSVYLQAGGTGWTGGWDTPGGLDATVTAGSLTFGNLAVTLGALATAGNQPPAQGSSVAYWLRGLDTPLGGDGTTAYLSFLFQPNTGYGFYGGLNFGNVFAGLSGNQLAYGLEGTSGINLSTVAATVDETALFVLQVDFLAGNDQLSLFINPIPGQSQPVSPDVVTALDAGTITNLVINNYGGFTVDEIRIGATFDSVTPVALIPEPAAYGQGLALLAAALVVWRRKAGRLLSAKCGAGDDSSRA